MRHPGRQLAHRGEARRLLGRGTHLLPLALGHDPFTDVARHHQSAPLGRAAGKGQDGDQTGHRFGAEAEAQIAPLTAAGGDHRRRDLLPGIAREQGVHDLTRAVAPEKIARRTVALLHSAVAAHHPQGIGEDREEALVVVAGQA